MLKTICKILELIIRDNVVKHIKDNYLFRDRQTIRIYNRKIKSYSVTC